MLCYSCVLFFTGRNICVDSFFLFDFLYYLFISTCNLLTFLSTPIGNNSSAIFLLLCTYWFLKGGIYNAFISSIETPYFVPQNSHFVSMSLFSCRSSSLSFADSKRSALSKRSRLQLQRKLGFLLHRILSASIEIKQSSKIRSSAVCVDDEVGDIAATLS